MIVRVSAIACFSLASAQYASAQDAGRLVDMYWPEYIIHSCSHVPPAGYILTGYQYTAVGSQCQYNWSYIFESYFDKPIGHEMALCDQGVIPAGWFKIRDIASYKCSTTPPTQLPKPGTARVIKKFF